MAAMPWKFESSYPHQFWGCSSVDRALRSHRRGRGFESHQLHQKSNRPCGDFVFGGRDENTRDVGLTMSKRKRAAFRVALFEC